jgi:methylated-DNA-[protein]-cysteine S-methyltransferase
MTRGRRPCREIESALLAVATGEADAATAERAGQHVRNCDACRRDLDRYRAIDLAVSDLRAAPAPNENEALTRLGSRLADLRRQTLLYRIFRSPLGPILIARSETGVSCIEYLSGAGRFSESRLARDESVEALPDGDEAETLYRDLLEYIEGQRTRLEWRLDFRLARSVFHRAVLEVTAQIPYGAVRSYAGIADELGKPAATRAVAQALRWNPLAIVVPCHRVIGISGALTGYAGNRIALKRRLLAVEGVLTRKTAGEFGISRDQMYVLAPGQSYCLPSCEWLANEPRQRLVLFGSRQRAEAAGLAPCSDCRPDLHPLAR